MHKIINRLSQHYTAFPFDQPLQEPSLNLSKLPQSDYSDMLSDAEQRLITMHNISQLDCFTYRAVNKEDDGENVYWNPLEQPFNEFIEDDTQIYQTDSSYPPPDMIMAWCLAHE